MKFKVGQTIRLINANDIAAELGATAVVRHINDRYVSVVWIRDSKWNKQGDGGYYPVDFEAAIKKNQQLLFNFMD